MTTFVFGSIFTALTIGTVLGVYLAAHTVLGKSPEDRTKDLAHSVLIRVAALHGLALALVFASEVVEYQQLSHESAIEASAAANIYFDIARYGAPEVTQLQTTVTRYLEVAAGAEWDNLGTERALLPDGWAVWDAAYTIVLDLTPSTDREKALRENMLKDIHLIAEMRDIREHHAITSINGLFWFLAFSGVVLASVALCTYPPKRANLILISVYAAYTGIAMFTIYALSNPFSEPGPLRPYSLLNELAGMQAQK